MNEIFDKLLIRFLFTVFICVALLIYKYAHTIFYPSAKKQIFKRIYPAENSTDTLHIFSRLIGISLIFSTLEFDEYSGIFISSFHFFVWSILAIILYLISIYVMESIIFYNFEYKDEVLKKKNMSYGVISFTLSICLAFIIKTVYKESETSIVIVTILWLFAMVIFGFITRLYKYISILSFNSLMIQKNLGLAFSYSGFLLASTVIITSAFSHEHHDISSYAVQVILKSLLGALVLPIFRFGLISIFKIDETYSNSNEEGNLGFGIYEGSIFLTSALLSSVIIGQIHFGTIYPFF